MPCLRHRMCCKRGSSRGRAARSSPSSHSYTSPSSLEHSHGRYLTTRSGRGRFVCQFRYSAQPSDTATIPPPLPCLDSTATLQTSHSAQFHFHCSMDRPRVIATISVSFKEESAEVSSFRSPKLQKLPHYDASSADVKGDPGSGDHSARSDNNNSSGSSRDDRRHGKQATGKASETKEPQHTALATQDMQANDIDEYRCLIVEETPPTLHDT